MAETIYKQCKKAIKSQGSLQGSARNWTKVTDNYSLIHFVYTGITVSQNPSQGANKKPGGFELQQQNRTGGSSWIN